MGVNNKFLPKQDIPIKNIARLRKRPEMTKDLLRVLFLLSLALTATEGQDKVENEKVATPIWYLDSDLTGDFTERSTKCGQNYAERKSEASKWSDSDPGKHPRGHLHQL